MVVLPPCRIWVVNYETKLGEYCPVVKEVCLCALIGKGMSVGTWKHQTWANWFTHVLCLIWVLRHALVL